MREDPAALRELVEDLQSHATPTLLIGEEVVRGFDPTTVSRMLGLKD